ncbi:MAG: hypothetical protein M3388_02900 [Acidobacteriota bacterium]|nr:hypothetical protein [Acidobacteriota bacterium]
MWLYRPVGLKELELIYDSGFSEFPPRLPHQPFFYPVLNFALRRADCPRLEHRKRSFRLCRLRYKV